MSRFQFGLAGLGGPRTERMLYGPPGGDRLAKFGAMFDVYEMGTTRYDHWTKEAAEALLARIPPNVLLMPRLSRQIVHAGEIYGQSDELERWINSVRPILASEQCGPIFVPWEAPWSPAAQNKLEDVISSLWPYLPSSGSMSVEFRHPSWYRPGAVSMLENYGAGLTWSVLAGKLPYRTTADFIHVRLTGAASRQVPDEVTAMLNQLKRRPEDQRPVHVISSRHHDPQGLRLLQRFGDGVNKPLALHGGPVHAKVPVPARYGLENYA